jgi:hypothetical protein
LGEKKLPPLSFSPLPSPRESLDTHQLALLSSPVVLSFSVEWVGPGMHKLV